jgi:hypothetical protein
MTASSMSPPTSSPPMLAWPSHREGSMPSLRRLAAWQATTTTQPRYTRRAMPAAAVGGYREVLASKGRPSASGRVCDILYRRRRRGRGMAAAAVNTSSSSATIAGRTGVSEHEASSTNVLRLTSNRTAHSRSWLRHVQHARGRRHREDTYSGEKGP